MLLALPPQPPGVPWPTLTWPEAGRRCPPGAQGLLEGALAGEDDLGLTLAVVAVQGGQLLAEAYGPTASAATPLISWSMAKSVTHAWAGLLLHDGLLRLDQPTGFAEWHDDDRARITLQHLLTMSSGLVWKEDYVDAEISHVIEMLFGTGKDDTAAFAAGLPLAAEPGTQWCYSSGTTNLVARMCRDALGGGEAASRRYLQERLFGPLGMTSADPRFDAAGTFIGSSFLYATAQDFARFGLLYLRDGIWDGRRLLPEGWADHARTPTPGVDVAETHGYGAHWWLWRPATLGGFGTFGAHGYEGQYTLVVPALDLVIVRLGKSPEPYRERLVDWLTALVNTFA